MAATGKDKVVESRDPVLTEIARLVNTPLDVESLAARLLLHIPPHGNKFVENERNEAKEWNVIALEAMRKW